MAERRKIIKYKSNFSSHNNNSVVGQPNSSVYNIYLNKDKINNSFSKSFIFDKNNKISPLCGKRKIPLYNNPFYSPGQINKRINYKILCPKNNKSKYPMSTSQENSSSYVSLTKRDDLLTPQNVSIHPVVYIRKNTNNNTGSPKRCLSQNSQNTILNNKMKNSHLTLTPNRIDNSFGKKNKNGKDRTINSENFRVNRSPKQAHNPNIININLYNEKNNYIENNIVNNIYMNKNKIKKSREKEINRTSNDIMKYNEKITLTERVPMPRRSNYSFYYNSHYNNIRKKNINRNTYYYRNNSKQNEKINIGQKYPQKKINNLPKVQRKPSIKYNESAIIKIQSVLRGYLLNKKLDKYLKHYLHISEGIKIIENIFKRKVILVLKNMKINKKYYISNISFYSKRNSNSKNFNNEKNLELQFKINELINEKKELKNNYENLKEIIRKYNELIKEKQEMQKEIDILKQKNNELSIQLNNTNKSFYNNNKKKCIKFIVQRQTDINIIMPKRVDLIYPKFNHKKFENKNDYFTLGTEYKENDEANQPNNIESIRMNKIKYLIQKKETKNKFILLKYFIKFYFLGMSNIVNMNIPIRSSRGNMINLINRRYNNEGSNFFSNNNMSIKTLSDNSSFITDRKSQILPQEKLTTDEDNKKNKKN